MTKAELILVDLVLLKLPINKDFTQRAAYHNVLIGRQDDYDSVTLSEMNKIITSENSVIIDFLQTNKYIDCVDQPRGRFLLNEKGEIAQRQKGHEGYKKWENRQNKFKTIKEVAFWLTFVAAIISAFGVFYPTCKGNTPTNLSKDTTVQQTLQQEVIPSQILKPESKKFQETDSLSNKKVDTAKLKDM